MNGQPDFSAMWRALWGRIEAYIDLQFVERGFTGRYFPAGNLRGTIPAHNHDEYATDGDLSTHAGDADAHHAEAHEIIAHSATGGSEGDVPTVQSDGTLALQAPAGGASSMDDLSDVDLSTPPTDGQALVYDDASGTWKPGSGAPSPDANAIHDNEAGEIAALAEKATPVSADLLLIEDSEDSNAKKRISLGSLSAVLGSAGLVFAAGLTNLEAGLALSAILAPV